MKHPSAAAVPIEDLVFDVINETCGHVGTGKTALLLACEDTSEGHVQVVDELVDRGARIRAVAVQSLPDGGQSTISALALAFEKGYASYCP